MILSANLGTSDNLLFLEIVMLFFVQSDILISRNVYEELQLHLKCAIGFASDGLAKFNQAHS